MLRTSAIVSALAAIASGASTSQSIEPANVCSTDTSSVATFASLTEWEAAYNAASCSTQVVDTITLNKDSEVCIDSTKKILAINADFSSTKFNVMSLSLKSSSDTACGVTVIAGYANAFTDCSTLPDDAEQVVGTVSQKNLSSKNTWDMSSTPLPLAGAKSVYITVTDCEFEDDGSSIVLKIAGDSSDASTSKPDSTSESDGDSTNPSDSTKAPEGIASTIAAASIVSATMAYMSL